MSEVEIDLVTGEARLAGASVPVSVSPDGALSVAGSVLRPLTFGERDRVVRAAAAASAPRVAVAQGIHRAATRLAGGVEPVVGEILSMHLAGAGTGSDPPDFDESMLLLGRAAGWSMGDIASAEASTVDRLAQRLATPEPDDGWRRVVFRAGRADDGLVGLRDALADALLARVAVVDRGSASETGSASAANFEIAPVERSGAARTDAAAPSSPRTSASSGSRVAGQDDPLDSLSAERLPAAREGQRPERRRVRATVVGATPAGTSGANDVSRPPRTLGARPPGATTSSPVTGAVPTTDRRHGRPAPLRRGIRVRAATRSRRLPAVRGAAPGLSSVPPTGRTSSSSPDRVRTMPTTAVAPTVAPALPAPTASPAPWAPGDPDRDARATVHTHLSCGPDRSVPPSSPLVRSMCSDPLSSPPETRTSHEPVRLADELADLLDLEADLRGIGR